MSDQEIFERVKKVVATVAGRKEEEVTPNSSFTEDLGMDSLDVVQCVMDLEEAFSIEIPDTDVEHIRTVSDAVNYIREKIGNGAP
ncbi:MAG: acyl carrier protein [Fimbriimonadales bacterium]|nr:acyl carrier protein [Fimbriimonadales bacterium]